MGWWRRLVSWWGRSETEVATRRAVRALDLTDGDRVCELGFGFGITLPHLLAALPEGQVLGVDPSPQMVRLASRQYRPWVQAGQLQLIEASTSRTPIPAGSVNRVVTVDAVDRWPDLDAGFGEAARVLVPDGRLVALLSAEQAPGTADACVEALCRVGFAVAVDSQPDGSVMLVGSPLPTVV